MKHFFIRLALFLSPIALTVMFIIASAFYIGDAVPIPLMFRWQQQSGQIVVYQPWSLSGLIDYKYSAIHGTNPRLLVLGSSRMTLFRAALANNDPSQFYNAGIPSTTIFDTRVFFERVIANDAPDVVIIGLDLNNYNRDNYFSSVRITSPSEITLIDNARYVYGSLRRVSRMWLLDTSDMMGYFTYPQPENVTLTGLQTLTTDKGFLYDGSRYVIDIESNIPLNREMDAISFEQRSGVFIPGENLSADALAETRAILELARANNVAVIGILPPYRPSYYDRMMESGEFNYMPVAVDALQSLFDDYGFPLHDYTDPSVAGGSDAEMTDVWHFSDLLSLRIYYDLLIHHPELLGEFSDAETLSNWLTEYQNNSIDFFTINLP